MFVTYKSKLIQKKQLAGSVYLFRFSYPTNADWTFLAGQYMIFHIPQKDSEHMARRQYSIASAPNERGFLDFIIEIVPDGVGSTYLHKMEIGQELTMQGPAGIFIHKQSENDLVMLATGTGIAPIYSIVVDRLTCNVKRKTPNIYLLWGLKYKEDIYLKKELDELASKNPNFKYKICLSQEKNMSDPDCFMGRVTHGFEEQIKSSKLQATSYKFYICGSKHIVDSLRTFLEEKNIPKNQIHFEKFTI